GPVRRAGSPGRFAGPVRRAGSSGRLPRPCGLSRSKGAPKDPASALSALDPTALTLRRTPADLQARAKAPLVYRVSWSVCTIGPVGLARVPIAAAGASATGRVRRGRRSPIRPAGVVRGR
ncbi:hypothetical protein, partial [Streptomyces prasinopilosus]|uniref:hypothetical protein n=1 Tax=Streptomyces prasinopilosus TaxID=67344 RepID=UPI003CC80CB2